MSKTTVIRTAHEAMPLKNFVDILNEMRLYMECGSKVRIVFDKTKKEGLLGRDGLCIERETAPENGSWLLCIGFRN